MLYCTIGSFCGTSLLHQETEDWVDLEVIWTGEEYMGPRPNFWRVASGKLCLLSRYVVCTRYLLQKDVMWSN